MRHLAEENSLFHIKRKNMGKKVLVIDDDKDVTEAMRIALEANDYDVAVASSGKRFRKSKDFQTRFNTFRCNDGYNY